MAPWKLFYDHPDFVNNVIKISKNWSSGQKEGFL